MRTIEQKSLCSNPANSRALQLFNVRVHRSGGSRYIGQVSEKDEGLGRLAALSRYGVAEDDVAPGTEPNGDTIFPGEEFDVSPA